MTEPRTLACETALAWVDDAVRDRLPAERTERLAAHLERCGSCRSAHDDALAVRRALRDVPTPVCPDHLVARIMDATAPRERAPATPAAPVRASVLERLATWLAAATWRPIVATAAALVVIVAVAERVPGPPSRSVGPPDGTAVASRGPADPLFCEDDIDALLATIDLRGIDEEEARRAAEEACLAFGILARAMRSAAGAAESGLIQSLEAPIRKGVESGIESLPPPLQRPGRETLDRRG
jgi:hypothetical protein